MENNGLEIKKFNLKKIFSQTQFHQSNVHLNEVNKEEDDLYTNVLEKFVVAKLKHLMLYLINAFLHKNQTLPLKEIFIIDKPQG